MNWWVQHCQVDNILIDSELCLLDGILCSTFGWTLPCTLCTSNNFWSRLVVMMHLTTVVTKFNTLHKPQNITAEKHSTTAKINTPGPQYEIISSSKLPWVNWSKSAAGSSTLLTSWQTCLWSLQRIFNRAQGSQDES